MLRLFACLTIVSRKPWAGDQLDFWTCTQLSESGDLESDRPLVSEPIPIPQCVILIVVTDVSFTKSGYSLIV
jgi:hypothetical protein